ncbi:DNA cytosine methyltransferase [Natronosalvus amylolyticus]|uniref:DNA cytosine methyltransferase n=1 Tax=Natronosalvus amylolyticus TaxID=2961994 RepID=UPI0020C96C18|nr:DNA cytosine methyltransferase [Natronosalvus amylolyticus]
MSDSLTIVDLFCGAGGFSTGVARACEDLALEPGTDVELHAINHWDPAIETHRRNHPWAEHYNAKIEEVHPPDIITPGEVDLIVGGPSCTHFSSARGGKPVKEQKRSSAWSVLKWVELARPKHLLVENVREFRSWGPVDEDGKPTRDGSIFRRWVGMLEALGYTVDHRVLCAADYGDPTTRERLFVAASKTKRPTYPDPTHAEEPTSDKHQWRSAAEIIDWSDTGGSIFTRDLENARVQPLAQTTMARIAEGIRRHCDDRLEPLADALAEIGPDELRELRERVVPAEYAPIVAKAIDEPFLVAGGAGDIGLTSPCLLRQQSGGVPSSTDAPTPTISTRGAIGLATPETRALVKPRNGARRGLHSNALYDPENRPLHTVTAKNHDGHLVSPKIVHYSHGGALKPVDRPMATIATERGGAFGLSSPYLCPLYNSFEGQRPRTRSLERPLMTVTASKSPAGLASPYLIEYYGNGQAQPIDTPLPTATTRDRFALCVPECFPWGLDVRYRMLQPRELKQAQGFPAEYDIAGSTKADVTEQIGNAVPVNLARALAGHLLAAETPSLSTFGGGIAENPDASVPDFDEVVSDD